MSTEITIAFVQQYENNVIMLSQQTSTKLMATCIGPTKIVGSDAYFDRIGARTAKKVTTRHGDTPATDTPHSRRKVTMVDYEDGDIIDDLDTVKMLIDPTSPYALTQAYAFNRAIDDAILDALGGTSYSGVAGATSINAYDSGECRVVAGDGTVATAGSDSADTTETTLTLAKVMTCKNLLDEADVDPDLERFFVCNFTAINNWLQVTEVKSVDYNTIKALAEGRANSFAGFTFIPLASTRFNAHTVDTACYECFAYAKGGVGYGAAANRKTRIAEDPGKRFSVRVYSSASFGATRIEGPKVVKILIKKT